MKKLFFFFFFCAQSFYALTAQTVTPWLTRGDQSVLLQQQPTTSFSTSTAPGDIQLDPSTTFQSMDGFGFCLTQGSAFVINQLGNTERAALLNELFGPGGLGISALRISIGASDLSGSVYTYNETPGDVNMDDFSLNGPDLDDVIPLLQDILLINPDIKILATPWTAPTWMKTNGTWIGGSLLSQYQAAYALYFVRYLEEMNANGISIWAVTPQNEPENPFNEPSMLMGAIEQTDFINNHLGPAIQQAGFATKIIAFDHNCDNTAYPIQVLNNSSYAAGAAFHLYAGDISAMTTVKEATNKEVHFTEQYTDVQGNFGNDLSWHLRNVVIGSINNWSRSVFEWNLATDLDYGPRTPGGCTECLGALTIDPATGSISRNVSYYIIGQIAKFTQPGALRITSSTDENGISTAALRSDAGKITLLVFNDNQRNRNLSIQVGNQAFSYTIPKKSAITFTWNDETLPPPTPPTVPDNLTATATSSSDISLSWADNSTDETAFNLERSPDGIAGWQSIGTTAANENSFTDSGLTAETTYHYRVNASNGAGSSAWSAVATATTQSGGGNNGQLSGIHNVIAQHSNKGLDVINQSGNNNANVQQWEILNGGGNNQRWDLLPNLDGSYRLIAVHSNKCLSLKTSNGSDVVQKNCDGSSNQSWQIIPQQTDHYQIQNLGNGQSLEVRNADLSNGANVETGTYDGSSHQLWRFDPVTNAMGSTSPGINFGGSDSKLSVYPIPANDRINFQLPPHQSQRLTVRAYDTDGRLMLNNIISAADNLTLNVSQLIPGWYTVVIMGDKGMYEQQKVLIDRK